MAVRADGVAAALTQSGRFEDGTDDPAHVLLTDVEAVLVDTIALTRDLAGLTGYRGSCLVTVDIAWEGDRPLELRSYDEAGGESLRPAAGYDTFVPVQVHFTVDTDEDEIQRLIWKTLRRITISFGVFEPQLIRRSIA